MPVEKQTKNKRYSGRKRKTIQSVAQKDEEQSNERSKYIPQFGNKKRARNLTPATQVQPAPDISLLTDTINMSLSQQPTKLVSKSNSCANEYTEGTLENEGSIGIDQQLQLLDALTPHNLVQEEPQTVSETSHMARADSCESMTKADNCDSQATARVDNCNSQIPTAARDDAKDDNCDSEILTARAEADIPSNCDKQIAKADKCEAKVPMECANQEPENSILDQQPLDGSNIILGLIKELSTLNEYILQSKKEMQVARRERSAWLRTQH